MATTWGSVYLANNPSSDSLYPAQSGFDCIQGKRLTAAEVIQEDAIVRGTTMSRISRGNMIREGSFTVHRQHSTAADAQSFQEAHPQEFAGLATLTWDAGAWANASVVAEVEAFGTLTITHYRVRGQT